AIDRDLRQRGAELQYESNSRLGVAEGRDRLLDHRVQVAGSGIEMRHPGKGRKFAHQALQILDLADNRARTFVNQLAVAVGQSRKLAPQTLGRELDRSERILDFVRDAARDLAP